MLKLKFGFDKFLTYLDIQQTNQSFDMKFNEKLKISFILFVLCENLCSKFFTKFTELSKKNEKKLIISLLLYLMDSHMKALIT